MPAQPAITTGWNSSGSNQVQPSSGKKALGWVVGEKPASSYFNWLFFTIEAWLVWLSTLLSTTNSWTDGQTFTGGSGQASAIRAFGASGGNNAGVVGTGAGLAAGVEGEGGPTAGSVGVAGFGGSGGGYGVQGTSVGAYAGVQGVGSSTGSYGVQGTGTSTTEGVHGSGGTGSGPGVVGDGGSGGNADGTYGSASGSGAGAFGQGAGGPGVEGQSTSGPGGLFTANSTRGNLALTEAARPSGGSAGDIYVDSTTHNIEEYNGAIGGYSPLGQLYFDSGLITGIVAGSFTAPGLIVSQNVPAGFYLVHVWTIGTGSSASNPLMEISYNGVALVGVTSTLIAQGGSGDAIIWSGLLPIHVAAGGNGVEIALQAPTSGTISARVVVFRVA